ncbi:DNA helicase UvrD [Candidatus Dojkabacteria bacterium]|nr:DNA helicase UvrD [Candidatus Dojkabacteria bacterium]
MRFYADLHIHSRFSRACSKQLTLSEIYKWCRLKGVSVIATGDYTHPEWLAEIKEQLSENNNGLYELDKNLAKEIDSLIPESCKGPVRFLLSTEISLIYKKKDRVRKVHNVILAPRIEVVEKLNKKLAKIGNLQADGRPILGLDARDLLEIVLETSEECILIPAHIWTPWFSIFGDKSGFDSIKECFEDLSDHIYAIETGLSSDPAMNWMIKELDNITIISNSDAHSPEKIAREANIFDCKLSFTEIIDAIKKNDKRFKGTLEFYPEEGKYHYDGHRSCNVRQDPKETIKTQAICPKCKKRLTVGVLNRVFQLAQRKRGEKSPNAKHYFNIIPLKEILSEIMGKGPATKTVNDEYFKILARFGSELGVLQEIPATKLSKHSDILAQAISRMRAGSIDIQPGYDGLYGEISIFDTLEREQLENRKQLGLAI